jgi:hypothetical protein
MAHRRRCSQENESFKREETSEKGKEVHSRE